MGSRRSSPRSSTACAAWGSWRPTSRTFATCYRSIRATAASSTWRQARAGGSASRRSVPSPSAAPDRPRPRRQGLLEKAESVPLFSEEVTKTLLDLGMLRREGDAYRGLEGVGALTVPDTIQGSIMARLDRLGEDGKRTVQLASVIGRQFLGRLLQRVAGLAERLTELLEELKDLEIIYELGLAPEPAYIF